MEGADFSIFVIFSRCSLVCVIFFYRIMIVVKLVKMRTVWKSIMGRSRDLSNN